MNNLYLHDDCIISPLGFTTLENLEKLRNGTTGLKQCATNIYLDSPICAGIIDADNLSKVFSKIGNPEDFTKLEQMMLLAIQEILNKNPDFDRNQNGLIISTTKGNVHLLEDLLGFEEERILLSKLDEIIKDFFGFKQKPIVVSNACISGGLALSVAKKMISVGQFSEAIVVGGDMLSKFIVSGFNSFQALSDTACKPFSKDRNGINLGEAAAAVLVSDSKKAHSNCINLVGDASANDANHISGPSRTGEGLHKSIQNSLKEANISSEVINAISTHGTATVYNDEMEAIAVSRNNLTEIPLNSIKGYYGHTLGASALIESIVCKHMMLNNEIYPSLNFTQLGVSEKINVVTQYQNSVPIEYMLKTASGFGGCNLAMIFKKEAGNGES
ncbi:beta-ketoacyl synthase N-terminal-like domain-containing protein [Zunongwangia sp. HGR-M22]|uniref:beta-ketoacyl synthase N-terminal-like domain-containing protein n=1 Tax=Zunongwangia sp. HGR-M22 TaxID=3015168 RepID=UPI0022DD6C39|nr:beta-ketoacyl synthase N-terminal-like domain-containing protein [Zunongwangia sp. HGR-M22]WBL27271.1 beta-ketoacyl synthase N-terminal-like domain-containing protein [Zunongwangia sp. HGR-M22]